MQRDVGTYNMEALNKLLHNKYQLSSANLPFHSAPTTNHHLNRIKNGFVTNK